MRSAVFKEWEISGFMERKGEKEEGVDGCVVIQSVELVNAMDTMGNSE